jgi:hypothetical protein
MKNRAKQKTLSVSTRVISGLALVGVLVTMAFPFPVQAQPPGSDASSPSDTKPKKTGGRKKISLEDDFLVEGQLEKPSAYYVFRRSAMDYDWARLDAQFTPLVLESIQDPLF